MEGMPLQAAADEVAGPVFGAFARYCKCTTEADDKELKKALLLALCNLDSHLQSQPAYMAGARFSTTDAFLLPVLYHLQVAGLYFKDFEIPYQFDALGQYMDKHLNSEPMLSCTPPEAMVRWGWANARGDEAAAMAAEAELAQS